MTTHEGSLCMLADSIGLPMLSQEVSVGHAKAKGRSMTKGKKAEIQYLL